MIVVDSLAVEAYKTKAVVAMLNAVGAGKKNLVVNESVDPMFVKSAANIQGVKTTFAGSVNTYDVLNADKLIISEGRSEEARGGAWLMKTAHDIILNAGHHRELHGWHR